VYRCAGWLGSILMAKADTTALISIFRINEINVSEIISQLYHSIYMI
jgi:hypothetical protein